QNSVRKLIRAGLVKSAHDCSEGGLAVALAESCFNPHGLLGAEIDVAQASPAPAGRSKDQNSEACAILFNESQSRIVISGAPNDAEKILSILGSENIPHGLLGRVATKTLQIKAAGAELSWSIVDLYDDWFNAIRHAV